MITQSYKLNMIPDKVLPVINVSQYDSSRTIVFYLYDGEEEYTPTSVSVKIGTTTLSGTISSNSVSIVLPSSLMENSGELKGELIDADMGSLNFIFNVDSTPLPSVNPHDQTLDLALSMILGRNVQSEQSGDALNILFGGER